MSANTSKYSPVRAPGHEHVPLYPKGFIAIRIVQLVLAVIVLGLAAFGIWWYAFDGNVFILTVAIMTLIASIYHLVAHYNNINLYNYWAVLSLDILLVIMWLSSFALLASEVAAFFAIGSSYSVYSYYIYDSLSGVDYIVVCCLAAASALGGVQFVTHIVSLIIHSINLHRHRAAGLHCTPGQPAGPAPAAALVAAPAPGAEKSQVVYQTMPQPAPAPAYVQAYPAQMQPQQFYAVQPQQGTQPGQAPVQLPANQVAQQPMQ